MIMGKRAQKIKLHSRISHAGLPQKRRNITFAPKIDECHLIELPYYNLSSYSYLSSMYKQYDSQNAPTVRLYLFALPIFIFIYVYALT